MYTAYFDCFSGISGDMIIGALIDAGLDSDALKNELNKLPISGYKLDIKKVLKNGISGTKFNVTVTEKSEHRTLKQINCIINESSLDDDIKEKSRNIFLKIAQVEAGIHNKSVDDIHFHEIGALDSIIDIVGSVIALKLLQIKTIYSSKIPLGNGFIKSEHGIIPIPAPATIELLKGVPVYSKEITAELTTPTGAAIIAYFSEDYVTMPEMRIKNIGYGAGTRDLEIPNLLRVIIGEASENKYLSDTAVMIETNIDDMNPEFYEYLLERLMNKGAFDAYTVPIIMKKSRPAVLLNVLTPEDKVDEILEILFLETTTSGVRINTIERKKLNREIKKIATKYGEINVKLHRINEKIITISPEYEECKKAAQKFMVPLKDVYDEVKFKVRSTHAE